MLHRVNSQRPPNVGYQVERWRDTIGAIIGEVMMAHFHHKRTYQRFPFHAPLIIGDGSFVDEGTVRNLSMHGCSMVCGRALPLGGRVRVSLLLPDQASALSIELGRITWVRGHECGVEFVQLPLHSRQRLNRTLRVALIQFLSARKNRELETRIA